MTEAALNAQTQDIFLSQWELSIKVMQLLGLWVPWWHQVAGTWTASAVGVMALSEFFFWVSCSWQSEGLFGQLFSVALPVQALRGPPCLVSFCCSECQAHRGAPLDGFLLCSSAHWSLKGVPWVGSYCVVQCTRDLMGQPLYGSAANAGVWGERGEGDGSPQYVWLSSTAFLHRYFPPQSPASHPLIPSLHSQQ